MLAKFRDVLNMVVSYLSYKDVLSLSSACSELRFMIFNLNFWKKIIMNKYPSHLWAFVSFDNVFEPIKLLFYQETIDTFLKYSYIQFRLSEPKESKLFFKLYVKFETSTLPPEHRLSTLCGELIAKNWGRFDNMHFRFKKNESVFIWRGEKDHNSKISMYAVDRKVPGSIVNFPPEDDYINILRPHHTILGKKDYKVIGKILYNDENYYEQFKSTTYNTSESHSYQRFHTERFGENSSSVSYPSVGVHCITHFDAVFPTNYIYMMCQK